MSKNRPTGITAIAIVTIILGVLGCAGGGFSIVGGAFQGAMANQMEELNNIGQSDPQFDSTFGAMQDLQRKTVPFSIGLGAANGVASTLLLIGGILLLTKNKFAPNGYIGAAVVSIVYAMAAAAVGAYMQYLSMELMNQMMGDRPMGSAPPELDLMMSSMGMVGICFGVVWAMAKIAFYGWSIAYVNKREIRDHYPA